MSKPIADGSVPPTTVTAGVPTEPLPRARLVLFTLTFVYVINFLDRSLLGSLAKPIQDSLGVTDTQLGLIGGLYFAFFYCFIAIPVGWLADRTSRVGVLSIACALWSGATALCGMAQNYTQLVIARMLVGVGEAGGVPPSYALITDYYPPGRRGLAFGSYNLGPPIGVALGIAFGATIAANFDWRMAFLAMGGIGIFAAIAVWLIVKEPPRGTFDAPGEATRGRAGFWDTMRAFFSKPTLVLAALGSGATQFITYGLGNFTTLFLMREKAMTLQEVAIWYALVAGVGMSIGMLVSGRAIDHFVAKSRTYFALIPAASLVLAIPLYLAFVWAPTWELSLVFLTGVMALNYFYLSSSITLVQEEVQPNQRVMAGALLLLIMNFIGLGLGPTYVGIASDYFKAAGHAMPLQTALYTLTPFYVIAIILFLWLARRLAAERNPVEAEA